MVPEPEILPTTSDTFVVYPSRPGYVAYRDDCKGSHMIQIMGKVFKMEAGKKHLYDLFVKVNREMVKINIKFEGGLKKTTLVMESTLTKSIYLEGPKA
ncbi:caspase-14-like [Rhinoraja longicauda]